MSMGTPSAWHESKRFGGWVAAVVGSVGLFASASGHPLGDEQLASLTEGMAAVLTGAGLLWNLYGSVKAQGPLVFKKPPAPSTADVFPATEALPRPEDILDMKVFFDSVRRDFAPNGLLQSQVDGVNQLLQMCISLGLDPLVDQAASVLGNVYRETGGRMVPIRESFADSDEEACRRIEKAWKEGKMPWVKHPYWRPDASGQYWFGRGPIQITHPENYLKLQKALGTCPQRGADVPYRIHDYPELALHPVTGAMIAVLGMRDGLFTGKKLSDYINPVRVDLTGARKIVNGTDHDDEVAANSQKFRRALARASGVDI